MEGKTKERAPGNDRISTPRTSEQVTNQHINRSIKIEPHLRNGLLVTPTPLNFGVDVGDFIRLLRKFAESRAAFLADKNTSPKAVRHSGRDPASMHHKDPDGEAINRILGC